MKFLSVLCATGLALSATAQEVKPLDLSMLTAGKAAVHGAVKDQGDIGFCWAFAWSSFLESKILLEKNRQVDLSAMYLGRTHMAGNYLQALEEIMKGPVKAASDHKSILEEKGITVLSRFQQLRKNPVELNLTREFLTKKFQEYSRDEEGASFTNLYRFGMVPVSAYDKKPDPQPNFMELTTQPIPSARTYTYPHHREKLDDFISNHLLKLEDVDQYLSESGKYDLERDLDTAMNMNQISEWDSFTFEGKKYTPRSFLRDFIGFDSSTLLMKPIQIKSLFDTGPHPIPPSEKTGIASTDNFEESVADVQKELDQRRPVLLHFDILDDYHHDLPEYGDTAVNSLAVFDPAYCTKAGQCETLGGHIVMIVNSLKDRDGNIKAFIVQNSWGADGRNDQGATSKIKNQIGFYIITLDYLQAAAKNDEDKIAFRYMKM